jgi:hypothetical protein
VNNLSVPSQPDQTLVALACVGKGHDGVMSAADDMSGLGSERSVRWVWPLLEGLDAPVGSPSGGAHGGFLNLLHRWESAELNKAEAADALGRAFAGRDWLNPESAALPG